MSWSASCPAASRRAFAHRVADVAEHEQIAERGARETDEIVGLAGDEAAREAFDRALALAASALARSTFSASAGSTGTLRSRASSRKLWARSASLAASAALISRAATAASNERAMARSASATGSSCVGQQRVRLEAARNDRQRGDRQGHGQAERQCDPRSGHAIPQLRRPPQRPRRITKLRGQQGADEWQNAPIRPSGAAVSQLHDEIPKTLCFPPISPGNRGSGCAMVAGVFRSGADLRGSGVHASGANWAARWCCAEGAQRISHGGQDRSPFPQHPGRAGDRDRRQGIHVRGRKAPVRPPARLPRHGRRDRDHLPLLLDPVPLRSRPRSPRGAPAGVRAGGRFEA